MNVCKSKIIRNALNLGTEPMVCSNVFHQFSKLSFSRHPLDVRLGESFPKPPATPLSDAPFWDKFPFLLDHIDVHFLHHIFTKDPQIAARTQPGWRGNLSHGSYNLHLRVAII